MNQLVPRQTTNGLSELPHSALRIPQPARLTAVHYGWLALGILVLTAYGSLIPFNYTPMPFDAAYADFRASLLVLPDLGHTGARGDWVLSIVLYLVLGFLLMAALCVDRHWAVSLAAAPLIVPFCVLLAVVTEFAQVYFQRTVNLVDISLESFGGLAGVLLWLAAGQRITAWYRRMWAATGLPALAARLLPGYAAVVLIVHLMPFDVVVHPGEIANKFQKGQVWLIPFHYRHSDLSGEVIKTFWNTVYFFPLGFLKALVPGRGSWAGRRWQEVLLFALLATSAVEFLQLMMFSRYCDATDIVTGTAAVLLGWWLGVACRDWWERAQAAAGRRAAVGVVKAPAAVACGAVFVVWLALVIFFNWRPFDFTADPSRYDGYPEFLPAIGLSRVSWVPLTEYYSGSKYQAVDQFLMKALLFAPLGVLVCLCLGRSADRWGGLVAVMLALPVAVAVELGQCYLPTRYPGMTDIFLESIGAWLGFAMARQLRSALWPDLAAPRARPASPAVEQRLETQLS